MERRPEFLSGFAAPISSSAAMIFAGSRAEPGFRRSATPGAALVVRLTWNRVAAREQAHDQMAAGCRTCRAICPRDHPAGCRASV